jgi:ribosomal protein S1
MTDFRVENPLDASKTGNEIIIKCIGVNDKGRVKWSRRAGICEAKSK